MGAKVIGIIDRGLINENGFTLKKYSLPKDGNN
jgi:hypothetical protein